MRGFGFQEQKNVPEGILLYLTQHKLSFDVDLTVRTDGLEKDIVPLLGTVDVESIAMLGFVQKIDRHTANTLSLHIQRVAKHIGIIGVVHMHIGI